MSFRSPTVLSALRDFCLQDPLLKLSVPVSVEAPQPPEPKVHYLPSWPLQHSDIDYAWYVLR